LTGLPDAIRSVSPDSIVQTCVVHVIRNAMRFVSYQDRKKIAAAMCTIYTAPTLEGAEVALAEFDKKWGEYPGPSMYGNRRGMNSFHSWTFLQSYAASCTKRTLLNPSTSSSGRLRKPEVTSRARTPLFSYCISVFVICRRNAKAKMEPEHWVGKPPEYIGHTLSLEGRDVIPSNREQGTSKNIAALLADLHIERWMSQPRVLNDNPYSEAAFKT
jgi:hypothetical protein